MLDNKNILLGISGGIAAYKSAVLTRLLVKNGANVKVIMTPMAKKFITPLTMATLSKNPILVDFYNPENGDWNSHVDLGNWADAFIIAPATANTISKMANAVADNLLITTYMSARCPVFVAPAMDLDMYIHPANKQNIIKLQSFGNIIIEPSEGELASGLSGKGRMQEPELIFETVADFFEKKNSLKNNKILVTAGPGHEKIDAVRYIGNYSSGKMGFAIAEEIASRGAKVVLITGPTQLFANSKNIEIIRVADAESMYEQCMKNFPNCNAAVFAAAVPDYTPANKSDSKIKKDGKDIIIRLIPTKDIAKELGKLKTNKQVTAGFALETDNEEINALKKLKDKNLNFIVLNSLNEKNTCFNSDYNKITIFNNNNEKIKFELKHKKLVAIDITNYLENEILNQKNMP